MYLQPLQVAPVVRFWTVYNQGGKNNENKIGIRKDNFMERQQKREFAGHVYVVIKYNYCKLEGTALRHEMKWCTFFVGSQIGLPGKSTNLGLQLNIWPGMLVTDMEPGFSFILLLCHDF